MSPWKVILAATVVVSLCAVGAWAWLHRAPIALETTQTPPQEHSLGGLISAVGHSSITVTSANPTTEGQDITLSVTRNTDIFFYISGDQGLTHRPASLKDLKSGMQVSVLYAGNIAEHIGVLPQ